MLGSFAAFAQIILQISSWFGKIETIQQRKWIRIYQLSQLKQMQTCVFRTPSLGDLYYRDEWKENILGGGREHGASWMVWYSAFKFIKTE